MGLLDDYLYGNNSTAGGGSGGKGGLLSKYLSNRKNTAPGATEDQSQSMASDADVHYKKHSKKHAKVCHKKHIHKKGVCK